MSSFTDAHKAWSSLPQNAAVAPPPPVSDNIVITGGYIQYTDKFAGLYDEALSSSPPEILSQPWTLSNENDFHKPPFDHVYDLIKVYGTELSFTQLMDGRRVLEVEIMLDGEFSRIQLLEG